MPPPSGQEGIPQHFGEPPRGGGIARFLAIARNFAMGTVGLAIVIFIAEKTLPAPLAPSNLIGSFVASVEVSEIKKKQDYAAGYAAAMAEAQAQAQARAQIEVEVNRQQQQRLSDSLETQVTLSNLADMACIGGQFLGLFGSDYRQAADAMTSTCGAGATIRKSIASEQANIGRSAGSVETRQIYAPSPAPASRPAAQPASDDETTAHLQYQLAHYDEWKKELGPDRVKQIDDSVPEKGLSAIPEFLNRLESAAASLHQ